jgi:hypothetical protein
MMKRVNGGAYNKLVELVDFQVTTVEQNVKIYIRKLMPDTG